MEGETDCVWVPLSRASEIVAEARQVPPMAVSLQGTLKASWQRLEIDAGFRTFVYPNPNPSDV